MMTILKTENLSKSRKACVYMGIGLLALSFALFLSTLIGVSEFETFAVLNQSGLKTLAGIAIGGCLLAAIGFFDE